MELIPASAEVLRELNLTSPRDLTADVCRLAANVEELVPSCVGISITVANDALTFTLVASSEVAARLDATQYETGGPCLDAAHHGHKQVVEDVLDEGRWQEYARAAAASNVRSSLALPLTTHERLTGSLNIYAADPHAFAGTNPQLRQLAGASADALVTNADLDFTSRDRANDAPRLLRESDLVDQAVGILMSAHSSDPAQAHERLQDAADSTDVSLPAAAQAIITNNNGQ